MHMISTAMPKNTMTPARKTGPRSGERHDGCREREESPEMSSAKKLRLVFRVVLRKTPSFEMVRHDMFSIVVAIVVNVEAMSEV